MVALIKSAIASSLRPRLLLLLLVQREQRHARHLDNLEAHTGNITDLLHDTCMGNVVENMNVDRMMHKLATNSTYGTALATESGNQNLVVLLDKVEATVVLFLVIHHDGLSRYRSSSSQAMRLRGKNDLSAISKAR